VAEILFLNHGAICTRSTDNTLNLDSGLSA